ncbi:MAG: alpha-glucuronidase family glycosyl hydrolase [Breznakibacter sp.]
MKTIKKIISIITICVFPLIISAQTGSNLWFTNVTPDANNLELCPKSIVVKGNGTTIDVARKELHEGLETLFQKKIKETKKISTNCLVLGLRSNHDINSLLTSSRHQNAKLKNDGFIICSIGKTPGKTLITADNERGILYGVFHYLRALQTQNIGNGMLDMVETPSYQYRLLNHWDNLDGTVERGYAGHSIFKWDEPSEQANSKYQEYARANASIGINGTVLNNVNATPQVLTEEYIRKAKVIADQLSPYGIKTYLSVNFSSPKELGGLSNSDPLNPDVRQWWKDKVKEIYSIIPDFGGFLVKANSEGLPGPQDYGRNHADGANMLAETLEPFGGIVMWRAFVYKSDGSDRAKQAYNEFMPLDGQFHKNVIVQVKNGPIDFQPREPISPLFGAMQHTPLMPELQITQEYLGFSDHLCYLGTLFEEFLDTNTDQQDGEPTVAQSTDGRLVEQAITGIAGVANIGDDANWCGHHFAQANWYVFGRMAWNNELSAEEIAEEWLRQTYTHNAEFVGSMKQMMMMSREAVVNYMTPIGLHHLMGWDHHYGPEPWCTIPGARPDWLPTYYHNADSTGIGFNRSSTGSNAVEQYSKPLAKIYNNPNSCPVELILWFHHLPWDYKLNTGRDVWEELCFRYHLGVEQAREMANKWHKTNGMVDSARHKEIEQKLAIQVKEAIWWRDACLLYFQTFSNKEIPGIYEKPIHKLEDLKKLKFNLNHHN